MDYFQDYLDHAQRVVFFVGKAFLWLAINILFLFVYYRIGLPMMFSSGSSILVALAYPAIGTGILLWACWAVLWRRILFPRKQRNHA